MRAICSTGHAHHEVSAAGQEAAAVSVLPWSKTDHHLLFRDKLSAGSIYIKLRLVIWGNAGTL